jgi:hypothetical protein
MSVPISNVVRRIVFAPSGTGPYAFTFEILVATDIEVYKGDTLLTLTTDYSVTINPNGTGEVTLVATAGTDNITIVGARTIQRTTDFVTGGDLFANSLNTELDSLTIFAQQNSEAVDRALRAPETDPTTINMTLPRAADRAGKFLSFDNDGNPVPGAIPDEVQDILAIEDEILAVAAIDTQIVAVAAISTSDIATLVSISADIPLVAAIDSDITAVASLSTSDIASLAGVASEIAILAPLSTEIGDLAAIDSDITAVAALSTSDIVTLAGLSTEITALAAIDSEIVSVAALSSSDISALASVTTDIQSLAPLSAEITALAAIDSEIQSVAALSTSDIATLVSIAPDISSVAAIDSDVTAVAAISTSDLSSVALISLDIGTVAGIASDVTAVAAIDSDVTAVAADATDIGTVASNIANVNTVAGISSNVTTVAGISADVTAVAGDATDIGAVAAIAANVTTVAGIAANVTTVAGISSDVTTVATNVADITNFSDVYLGPKSSDPSVRNDSSALQAGDLYFNTSDNVVKVYTGTAWTVAYVPEDGFLVAANNLSDLTNAETARDNLGIEVDGATGAFQLSVGTEAERPNTPLAGMIRFNDDVDSFEGYDGTDWGAIGGGGGATQLVITDRDGDPVIVPLANGFLAVTNRSGGTVNVVVS